MHHKKELIGRGFKQLGFALGGSKAASVYLIDGFAYAKSIEHWRADYDRLEEEFENFVRINVVLSKGQVSFYQCYFYRDHFAGYITFENLKQQLVKPATNVAQNQISMRTIPNFAQYLLTATDKIITKEGAIEVPVTKNMVTIKDDNGKDKTVSVGFVVNISKEMGEEIVDGEETAAATEDTPPSALSAEDEKTVKDAEEGKAGKKAEKEAAKAVKDKAKEEKAAAKKAKADTPKPAGVIATIFDQIKGAKAGKNGVTESEILAALVAARPDKESDSMLKTIKAQIGSNKRPVRMEREKEVTFVIETVTTGKGDDAKTVKHYSLKK